MFWTALKNIKPFCLVPFFLKKYCIHYLTWVQEFMQIYCIFVSSCYKAFNDSIAEISCLPCFYSGCYGKVYKAWSAAKRYLKKRNIEKKLTKHPRQFSKPPVYAVDDNNNNNENDIDPPDPLTLPLTIKQTTEPTPIWCCYNLL